MLNEVMESKELRKRKLVDLFNEGILKVGDKIPYHNKGEEVYISPFDQNGYGDQHIVWPNIPVEWQLFGIEKYATVNVMTLISESPLMPVSISGATGYLKGITELDKIASKLFAKGKGAMFGKNISFENLRIFLNLKYVSTEFSDSLYEGDHCLSLINIGRGTIKGYRPENFLKGIKTKTSSINDKTMYFCLEKQRVWNKNADILFKKTPYFISTKMDYIGEETTGMYKVPIEQREISKDILDEMYNIKEYVKFYGIMESTEFRIRFDPRRRLFDSLGREFTRTAAIRPIIYLHPDATMEMLEGSL